MSQAPYVTGNLPVLHGFTTRGHGFGGGSIVGTDDESGHGRAFGSSLGNFASLNLGLSSGDDEAVVERNRDSLLNLLGYERDQVSAFHQVHSDTVLDGKPTWFMHKADAAVTNNPNTLLVVSVADCLPVLLHDPVTGAVGAAHCGWRGTVAGLAAKVAQRMTDSFGSRPQDLQVVFGPGIAGECYQVGAEVVQQFDAAGFAGHVYWPDDQPDKYRLNISAANRWLLEQNGVPAGNITDLRLCTHCHPDKFYSYRRDDGVTGRHWAFISPAGR